MANKFDLVYWHQSVTASESFTSTIGGLIPAGRSRFLTFLRIERAPNQVVDTAMTAFTGMIGSVAFSNATCTEASAGRLINIYLHGVGMSTDSMVMTPPDDAYVAQIPELPHIEHPIVRVAGGTSSWMMFAAHTGTTANIYAIYYDE